MQTRPPGYGAAGVRLDTGQAEVTDASRGGRVGEIENLHDARRAPAVDRPDQVGDAGVALPPVLVGVLISRRRPAHLGHRAYEPGTRRVGDVPDLMALVAVRPQQVEAPGVSARKPVAGAHLDHLRAAGAAGRGDMGQEPRCGRIADVDHRRPVRLDGAGQWVQRLPGVVADVDDAALPLPHRQRLVGRAPLQAVRPDEPGIESFLAVAPIRRLRLGLTGSHDDEEDRKRRRAPALHHNPRSGYPEPPVRHRPPD